MGNGCCIENVYGVEYGFKLVKGFRIFTGKMMINDYWIVCVFAAVSVFGM